jgi:hypothetical protein
MYLPLEVVSAPVPTDIAKLKAALSPSGSPFGRCDKVTYRFSLLFVNFFSWSNPK